MDIQKFAALVILAGLLPVWLLFGISDWVYHRKSSIETTSGWRESGLHLILVAEAGFAVLPALFFQINALILTVAILAYVAHEITTTIDIGYAAPKRLISAHEQRIHDFLSAIPFAALAILIVTHGDQFLALFGFGPERADFSLAGKDDPLPTWFLGTWLLLSPINGILYLEEFIRCLRARRDRHRRGIV